MQGTRRTRAREVARNDLVRFLDSYASLLVLLLANFLLLEVIDDVRWGAVGSTLLAAVALVVAISDPETGHRVTRRHWLLIGGCVALAPLVLLINSDSLVGLTYLLPVALLVTATLPITLQRILRQRRVTYETVLGALCTYVLLGLLFAFAYLAVNDLAGPFFTQAGPHRPVGVPLLQLRHAHDARLRRSFAGRRAAAGADRLRGPHRAGLPGHDGRATGHPVGAAGRARRRALDALTSLSWVETQGRSACACPHVAGRDTQR